MMDDDLIDDSGFDLGLPSHEEMLKHQCDLLCSELELTRRNLRSAHRELAGLISMYRATAKELGALRVEHQHLKWTLTNLYQREREQAQGKDVMGYQYDDYGKK